MLGGIKKEMYLFIIEPQDDFFSVILPSLTAKYEF